MTLETVRKLTAMLDCGQHSVVVLARGYEPGEKWDMKPVTKLEAAFTS